jgi:hypothetical protein
MADDKLSGAVGARADALVTADPGCLMHLRGRAERAGAALPLVHIATALARGVGAAVTGGAGRAGPAGAGARAAEGQSAEAGAVRADEGRRA